jgi:hypothetical protein
MAIIIGLTSTQRALGRDCEQQSLKWRALFAQSAVTLAG